MKHRATLTTDTGNKVTVLADEKAMSRLQREATAKGWTLVLDKEFNQKQEEFNQNQSI